MNSKEALNISAKANEEQWSYLFLFQDRWYVHALKMIP